MRPLVRLLLILLAPVAGFVIGIVLTNTGVWKLTAQDLPAYLIGLAVIAGISVGLLVVMHFAGISLFSTGVKETDQAGRE